MATRVWYKSSAGVSVPAREDRGELTAESGTLRFDGRKQVITGRIRSVGRTQMGTNRWVHVRYEGAGETRDAYFMDSGLLGWAGVFGGNKRLAAALTRHATSGRTEPTAGA